MELLIEIFGTGASVIVAVSLMMKNLKRLRIINAVGAFLFAIYGFVLSAWPVFGLNFFIAVIDVFYLIQMANREDAFHGLKADPFESEYARLFLEFWNSDILKFNPAFKLDKACKYEAFFVLRDMIPVSLLIFKKRSEPDLEIVLDYAIPNYRDTKNSRYFFDWAAKHYLPGKKAKLFANTEVKEHASYLAKVGFKKTGVRTGSKEEWVKDL